MSKEVTCPRCKGKGTIYKDYLTHGKEEQCPNCKGTGTIRK
jgi:DnaJ-class molecular chaperone